MNVKCAQLQIPAQPAAPSGAADRKGKTSKGGGGGIIAAIDAVAAGLPPSLPAFTAIK